MIKLTFKIFFLSLFLLFLTFSFSITPVKAKSQDYQLSVFADASGYKTSNSIESITQNILKITLSLMGILFFAFALYGGMRWMTAQGNEDNVTTAKNTLEAAIIGLVVVAMSYAITNLIFSKINGGGAAGNLDENSAEVSKLVKDGGECKQNSDCESSVCGSDLKCVKKEDTCSTDSDCAESGSKCMGGVCLSAADSVSNECSPVCEEGTYCDKSDNTCKNGCAVDADCKDGKVCMPGNLCEFPTNIGASCGPNSLGKCAFTNNAPVGFGTWIDDYFSGQELCGKNIGIKCFFPQGKCVSNTQCNAGVCNSSNICDESPKAVCEKPDPVGIKNNTWVESGFNVCMKTSDYQSCQDGKSECKSTKFTELNNCYIACNGNKTCEKKCEVNIIADMGYVDVYCNSNYSACINGYAI